MTDERNNDNVKRWNVESLKEYFDLAITNLDEKIEQRFTAVKEAVNKAEGAHEKRLEGMNEFRNQLKDQQLTFLTKDEYRQAHATIEDKITEITRKLERYENIKQGANVVWAYIIAGISMIIGIISVTIDLLT